MSFKNKINNISLLLSNPDVIKDGASLINEAKALIDNAAEYIEDVKEKQRKSAIFKSSFEYDEQSENVYIDYDESNNQIIKIKLTNDEIFLFEKMNLDIKSVDNQIFTIAEYPFKQFNLSEHLSSKTATGKNNHYLGNSNFLMNFEAVLFNNQSQMMLKFDFHLNMNNKNHVIVSDFFKINNDVSKIIHEIHFDEKMNMFLVFKIY